MSAMTMGGSVGALRATNLIAIVVGLVVSSAVVAGTEDPDMPDPVCEAASSVKPISLADALVQSLRNEPHVIMARQDLAESKADAQAAIAPFLPKGQLIVDAERLLPNNAYLPVTVVGTNVLGGTKSYSTYEAISVSWNIMSSGRDAAGLREARAEGRANTAALHSEFDDALRSVLKAYSDVYETGITLSQQGQSLILLKAMARRADERYQHGNGTTIAIGQARGAALDAERAFNETCRSLTEKSSALAKAMGMRLPPGQLFEASTIVPDAPGYSIEAIDIDGAIESDPAVGAANEKVTAAQEKLKQTHAAFGPQISIDARRDYLGQDPNSFRTANSSIVPNSYRVDVSFVQPIFPFSMEIGAVDKAKAEIRRAQARTDEARIEADAKLRTAVSASDEVRSSYRAANLSLREARGVVTLTESLYKAGRANLDDLEHARIDLQKIEAELSTLASERALAAWDVERAFRGANFPTALMQRVGIEFADEYLDGAP